MSYSYGYGSSSSGLYTNQQPQQYSAGTYASPSSATYGYATSQPARVVQGYPTATFTTGYTATAAAPAAAASTGGYGYFQRASDATTAFAAPKPASYAAPGKNLDKIEVFWREYKATQDLSNKHNIDFLIRTSPYRFKGFYILFVHRKRKGTRLYFFQYKFVKDL